ncbi:MAG: glycosyltransferase family 2 protein [Verrucomicrobiae bacterium]|nr:glycosyltransferase family 2 protein [Verrucomicrobiae bacterium]
MAQVNVTIPVYNEEARLKSSLPRLHRFLSDQCRGPVEIVIADNASTDRTLEMARSFSKTLPGVRVLHLEEKGRGRAVKRAWSESTADVLSYMDVDLSTDLGAFPPLIEALLGGGYDMAVGSRQLKPAMTTRGLKREIISRGYMRLVKALFRVKFSDAQCGFKAIRRDAAKALLPLVEDNGWFMDTELLILGEKLGCRILDLPVRWVDDPDSRVKLWSTAIGDLKGLIRLRRNFASGKYSTAGGANSRHELSAKTGTSAAP